MLPDEHTGIQRLPEVDASHSKRHKASAPWGIVDQACKEGGPKSGEQTTIAMDSPLDGQHGNQLRSRRRCVRCRRQRQTGNELRPTRWQQRRAPSDGHLKAHRNAIVVGDAVCQKKGTRVMFLTPLAARATVDTTSDTDPHTETLKVACCTDSTMPDLDGNGGFS